MTLQTFEEKETLNGVELCLLITSDQIRGEVDLVESTAEIKALKKDVDSFAVTVAMTDMYEGLILRHRCRSGNSRGDEVLLFCWNGYNVVFRNQTGETFDWFNTRR